MEMRFYFLILALVFALPLRAAEVLETFATLDDFASGEAVWNQALGKVHPSLQVVNYKAGATPLDYSVGDGSHGSFDTSTYAQFSVNGDISGNKIRFDLSRYPILKVTSFQLAAGWVLEPVGDAPLIIYSLSDVRIEGEIWCHGSDGGNAVGATAGSGGSGRCGGKNGGNGGSVSGHGSNGTDSTGGVTGGIGGRFTGGLAVGGGGGGSWNRSTLAGDGPNAQPADGGQAGISVSDPEFLTITGGGAGGAGGSGTAAAAGAGGGAGGGTVIIHAVGNVSIGTSPTSVTGFIYANGGKGGDSNVAGGPGGGGGGGSVQIFSGDTVHMYNQDGVGASQALQGDDGTNSAAAGGGFGGPGRSWVASVDYQNHGAGTYNPTEEFPVVPNNNTTAFTSTTQSVITKSIDLASTLATIDSVTVSPTSSDFQVQLRGSIDDFQSDDTGWTSDYALVANKRFVKMKFSITTSTPAAPTMLDQVSVQFTRGERKEFDLKSTGCGFISSPKPPSTGWFVFLLFLPLITLLRARRS